MSIYIYIYIYMYFFLVAPKKEKYKYFKNESLHKGIYILLKIIHFVLTLVSSFLLSSEKKN